MIKLKAISATLLAASAIGVGGLVTAPTASALPASRCELLAAKSAAYYNAYLVMNAYGETSYASYYLGRSESYSQLAIQCYEGI
jgi:hypothetical protein